MAELPTRFRVSGALPPAIHTPIYMTRMKGTAMTIKLNKVYSASSLHEGVWKKIKGAWDSESNAKPLPAMPPKKLTKAPNLGQLPSKENDSGLSLKGALVGGLVGGAVAGPWGAAAGALYGMSRKKK